jgi:hypothetical protein
LRKEFNKSSFVYYSINKKDKVMKKEILNLADDLFLVDGSAKRNAFILEFQSAVALMREDDFDQFYAFADIIMQKYD